MSIETSCLNLCATFLRARLNPSGGYHRVGVSSCAGFWRATESSEVLGQHLRPCLPAVNDKKEDDGSHLVETVP